VTHHPLPDTRASAPQSMSALAFDAATRHVSACSSGRDLGAARRVGSAHRLERVTRRRCASSMTDRGHRARRRDAAAAPSAEKYAVTIEDAKAMFDEQFPPGTIPLDLRETACGRGLVALDPIVEGDLLLSFPWKHTVHVFEDGYDDPDDLRLALELLRVLNHGGDGVDDERVSVWRDYKPMLPSSTGAAAFWPLHNVKELQHGDAVEEVARLRAGFQAHAVRHACASLKKEDILWALSLVHSRSFSVATPEGTARALVPFADLFNHRPESPAQARKTDAILQKALFRISELQRDAFPSETNGSRVLRDEKKVTSVSPRAAPSEAFETSRGSVGSEPWSVARDPGTNLWTFQVRSIWRYDVGEEVFITYGHETSAELLASYGFFPQPNAGDFVRLYADVQDILDDDRFLDAKDANSPRLAYEREAVMRNASAAEAPLAVRPGGVSNAAHLLGCLRLMHARGETLGALRDEDVPHIGHSAFVWSGDEPCGMWAEKDAAKGTTGGGDRESGGTVAGDVAEITERRTVDEAALGQASARCVEMLAEFPTTLEEDESILRELAESAARRNSRADDDDDVDDAEQYAVAVSYRVTVKRMLVDFVEECAALGVQPSEW